MQAGLEECNAQPIIQAGLPNGSPLIQTLGVSTASHSDLHMSGVLSLQTVPYGPSGEVHWGSDVEDLHFDGNGLVVRVACEVDDSEGVRGLEIAFKDASAFRYLDELDLAQYWMSEGFVRGHHVLEVTAGGWSQEINQSQGYDSSRREWLVVTGNGCISVFALPEPAIRELHWSRAA